ncbi:hypothetical protein MSIBF_A4170002 [groundwater metagenome]|uniref:Uncharacterized protein n=1 Tax=groundwater metagenome TaxID=717931 RepID=A0A098EEV5_9ZZZZ
MLEKFIDATVRRNVWTLFSAENNIGEGWGMNGLDLASNYHDDALKSLQQYEVSKVMFEIITKFYMLSTIRLSKKEIIQNLKKKYDEDDIRDAFYFLEEKVLVKEYLEIPNIQDTIVIEIFNNVLSENKKSGKFYESTKFYGASIYFRKNIARIFSKDPIEGHHHSTYISAQPLTFMRLPKDKWKVDLLSIDCLEQRIHKEIFNKFISKNCVVESPLYLSLHHKVKEGYESVDVAIKHNDYEKVKKMLLKRILKKVKRIGGRNISLKENDDFNGCQKVLLKYTISKEILLPLLITLPIRMPLALSFCFYRLPLPFLEDSYSYIKKGKNNEKEIWTMGGRYLIRNKKKGEKENYFFCNDESEDFDDIVVEDFGEYIFPQDNLKKFTEFVMKKFRDYGINKVEICHEEKIPCKN